MILGNPRVHLSEEFRQTVSALPDVAQTEVLAAVVGLQRFRIAREHVDPEGEYIYSRSVQAAGLDLRVLVGAGYKGGEPWIVAIGVYRSPVGQDHIRDAQAFWTTWQPGVHWSG